MLETVRFDQKNRRFDQQKKKRETQTACRLVTLFTFPYLFTQKGCLTAYFFKVFNVSSLNQTRQLYTTMTVIIPFHPIIQ
jgi:hypothetical protein